MNGKQNLQSSLLLSKARQISHVIVQCPFKRVRLVFGPSFFYETCCLLILFKPHSHNVQLLTRREIPLAHIIYSDLPQLSVKITNFNFPSIELTFFTSFFRGWWCRVGGIFLDLWCCCLERLITARCTFILVRQIKIKNEINQHINKIKKECPN